MHGDLYLRGLVLTDFEVTRPSYVDDDDDDNDDDNNNNNHK
jgi:hypothetical protein